MRSPCLSCTKVKNPDKCENKNCGKWRTWFLYEWEKIRAKFAVGSQKEKKK